MVMLSTGCHPCRVARQGAAIGVHPVRWIRHEYCVYWPASDTESRYELRAGVPQAQKVPLDLELDDDSPQPPACQMRVKNCSTQTGPCKGENRISALLGVATAAVICSSMACLVSPCARAGEDLSGLFTMKCAACHAGGGNVMQPGAALTKADMLRNSALEVQVVYSIIYSGKGKMYGFGENCTPKGQCTFGPKLTDAQVQGLAEYVIEKAEKGW